MASDRYDDYNQVSVAILFSGADLALTFTDIALDREWSAQAVGSARRAYENLLVGRSTFSMSEAELSELDFKLTQLKERLKQLGERLD